MRKGIIFGLLLITLMAGCSSEPKFEDNGQPGTIRVVVFNDLNQNDFKDEGEVLEGEEVAIQFGGVCPPANRDDLVFMNTDGNGEAIFTDLQPGVYCVLYTDNGRATMRTNYEIGLSSEELVSVGFGVEPD